MTVAAPVPESFVDVRCPACVKLGWPTSKLLFQVTGHIEQHGGASVIVKCPRCKSRVSWVFGLPLLAVVELGPKNDRRKTVAFE